MKWSVVIVTFHQDLFRFKLLLSFIEVSLNVVGTLLCRIIRGSSCQLELFPLVLVSRT